MTEVGLPELPGVQITGLWKVRAALSPRRLNQDPQEFLRWEISPGLKNDGPSFGLVGDLSSGNDSAFAGVTVFAELEFGESLATPGPDDWEHADKLAVRLAPWASYVMYDYAANAFAALVNGTTYDLSVPFITPEVRVVTSAEVRQGKEKRSGHADE